MKAIYFFYIRQSKVWWIEVFSGAKTGNYKKKRILVNQLAVKVDKDWYTGKTIRQYRKIAERESFYQEQVKTMRRLPLPIRRKTDCNRQDIGQFSNDEIVGSNMPGACWTEQKRRLTSRFLPLWLAKISLRPVSVQALEIMTPRIL